MAQRDADLATDYARRVVFVRDEDTASVAVSLVSFANTGYASAFVVDLGLSAGDETAPVISGITPAPGTQLASRNAPIQFDVTDLAPGVSLVLITAKLSTRKETQLVYNGSSFVAPYISDGSTVVAITNGFRFTVQPESQWLGDIEELFVYAVDSVGNVEDLP